jgi:AcrR family transcriptional regulator
MSTAPAATPSAPRSSILDVAVRLFGQQGYSGTSMRDIAKSVGVLPGSLYAHIDSKETLLVEIVEAGITSFLEAVEPAVASSDSADARLRTAICAHVEVAAQNPERSLVVFHQWRFLGERNLAAAIDKRRRYEQAFITIVGDGVRAGTFASSLNVRVAVLTILGALNWTPEWYSPGGPATPSELGDRIADTLLQGLVRRI